MEPSIILAVTAVAGNLLGKALELFAGNRDPASEAEVRQVAEEAYEPLKQNLSGGCVRVMKMLESGNLRYPHMLRKQFYPDVVDLSAEDMSKLDSEFRYRLEFLRQNGVVTQVAGGEYGITRLGLAFLSEARQRRDYYEELFGATS